MRGEYRGQRRGQRGDKGSPPLARGVQFIRLYKPRKHGITPACAGSTSCPQGSSSQNQDHPRLRGEYQCSYNTAMVEGGSPPLARGVLLLFLGVGICTGITPACAGSTHSPLRTVLMRQDHPRLRGEYLSRNTYSRQSMGSPPLARGVH